MTVQCGQLVLSTLFWWSEKFWKCYFLKKALKINFSCLMNHHWLCSVTAILFEIFICIPWLWKCNSMVRHNFLRQLKDDLSGVVNSHVDSVTPYPLWYYFTMYACSQPTVIIKQQSQGVGGHRVYVGIRHRFVCYWYQIIQEPNLVLF